MAIRAVVPDYLKSRRAEMERFERSLETEDFDAIRVIGHNLKGSGGTYRFPQLSALGSELEEAARARDRRQWPPLLERLRGLFSDADRKA